MHAPKKSKSSRPVTSLTIDKLSDKAQAYDATSEFGPPGLLLAFRDIASRISVWLDSQVQETLRVLRAAHSESERDVVAARDVLGVIHRHHKKSAMQVGWKTSRKSGTLERFRNMLGTVDQIGRAHV